MYGDTDHVIEVFDTTIYDPTRHAPSTADLGDMLTRESDVLDGQIGHLVTTPVIEANSPKLFKLCGQIVVLRVRADVYDRRKLTDQGEACRAQAERYVKGITAGGIADGVGLVGGQPQAPGAPGGDFPAATMTMDKKF